MEMRWGSGCWTPCLYRQDKWIHASSDNSPKHFSSHTLRQTHVTIPYISMVLVPAFIIIDMVYHVAMSFQWRTGKGFEKVLSEHWILESRCESIRAVIVRQKSWCYSGLQASTGLCSFFFFFPWSWVLVFLLLWGSDVCVIILLQLEPGLKHQLCHLSKYVYT